MTQLSEQTDYAYAVGRVRSLERLLLDRSTIIRLLEEPLPGVCRILEEHGYPPAGDICGDIPDERVDAFISPKFVGLKDGFLGATFKEIGSLSRNTTITSLLPLRYDCLNLARLLKARRRDVEVPRQYGCGTISPEELERLVDEEGVSLPSPLRDAYRTAMALGDGDDDVRLIGCRILAIYWRHFLRVARSSGLTFLRQLAARRIDGANLSTLVRLKLEGVESLSRLDEELLPAPPEAGERGAPDWEPIGMEPLPRSFYRRAWGEPLESLAGMLVATPYARAAEEAMSSAGPFDSLVFDREIENLVGVVIRQAKLATFGIEPLLAFAVARELEVANLRVLLGGRAVGLPAERILEELRYGYV